MAVLVVLVTSVLGPSGMQINLYTSVLFMEITIAAILIAPLNNFMSYSHCPFLNLQIRPVENSDDEIFKFLNEKIPLSW